MRKRWNHPVMKVAIVIWFASTIIIPAKVEGSWGSLIVLFLSTSALVLTAHLVNKYGKNKGYNIVQDYHVPKEKPRWK